MIALDCSNYTGHITVEQAAQARLAGVSRAIVGLQYPTGPYPRGVAAAQLLSWLAAGVEVDVYFESTPVTVAWPYVGDFAHRIRRAWLSVEESSGFTTVNEISDALDAIDALGLGRCGIYTSGYMWQRLGLEGIEDFADRDLWVADYDGKQDVDLTYPFGGWRTCAMKQYAGDTEFAGIKAVDLSWYEPAPVISEEMDVRTLPLDLNETIALFQGIAANVAPIVTDTGATAELVVSGYTAHPERDTYIIQIPRGTGRQS